MKSKLRYRVWQFWQSLQRAPGEKDLAKVHARLTPTEIELFKKLPVPDQNHSLRVLNLLIAEGESNPDLLKAALLHDIGKGVHPLRRTERIFAVLVGAVFPGLAVNWGQKDPRGLQRPLAVIQQHPEWGADLAQEAGSNQLVIWLIRHHEMDDLTGIMDQAGVELLKKLQQADNIN